MPTTFEVLFLGNFADIDPTEGNDDMENAGSLVGVTMGSAANPLAFGNQHTLSPINFAGGSSTSYDTDNNLSNDTFSLDGGPAQTFDSAVVYNATITYTDGTPPATISAVIMQDTDGNVYLAPETTNNADQAAITAAPIQSLTINSIIVATNIEGLTANRAATDFVCFTAGTRISTANGQRAVEDLSIGELIETETHGFQPIRWIGSRQVDFRDAEAPDEKLFPVRIAAGSLGGGLPSHDLVVSRQHRIMVSSKITERMFGASDVLVPAIKLVGFPGIEIDREVSEVLYHHILLNNHEVIFAEEAPVESLFTGIEALKAIFSVSPNDTSSLFFEKIGGTWAPEPVLPIPEGPLQKQLIDRHKKNGKPLLEAYVMRQRFNALDQVRRDEVLAYLEQAQIPVSNSSKSFSRQIKSHNGVGSSRNAAPGNQMCSSVEQ